MRQDGAHDGVEGRTTVSYDLKIATYDQPGDAVVESWLEARPELSVDGSLASGGIVFVRRGRPSFEVSTPTAVVDPDDVDEELAGATVAPRWYVEVSVSLALPTAGRTAARAFAKHVAQTCRGAAFDPQSEKLLWPPKLKKKVDVPSTAERISVLDLRWLFDPEVMAERGFTGKLLRLLNKHLPEALPRRYGTSEPFSHSFAEGGAAAFADFCEGVRAERWSAVDWKARPPCFGGHLSHPGERAAAGDGPRSGNLSLTLDGRVMVAGEPWLAAAEALFRAVVVELGPFSAAAYVTPGVEARRGSLWYRADRVDLLSIDWRDPRLGVPRAPVWTSYFDEGLTAELRDELRAFDTTPLGDGTLLRFGATPLDKDEIRARFRWFPEHVLAPPRGR